MKKFGAAICLPLLLLSSHFYIDRTVKEWLLFLSIEGCMYESSAEEYGIRT